MNTVELRVKGENDVKCEAVKVKSLQQNTQQAICTEQYATTSFI